MNKPEATKTELKHWIEKMIEDGKEAKITASDIMEFLEYTNCINPEINE